MALTYQPDANSKYIEAEIVEAQQDAISKCNLIAACSSTDTKCFVIIKSLEDLKHSI